MYTDRKLLGHVIRHEEIVTVTYKAKEIVAAIESGVELAKNGKQVHYGNDNPFPCEPRLHLWILCSCWHYPSSPYRNPELPTKHSL